MQKIVILFCSIFTLSMTLPGISEAYAQEDEFKFWTKLDVKKKVNNWDFNGEIEIREEGFFQKMERLSFQADAIYDLTKTLSAGASYMIMNFYDERFDDHQIRHRFQGITGLKADVGRIELSIREKAEVTFKDDSDRIEDDGDINTYRVNPEWVWRNRIKMEYDVKNAPVTPYTSAESFYFLNHPDGNSFEKIRYIIGIEYKINKQNRIELFGIYNQELVENEINSYVLGLGYNINL